MSDELARKCPKQLILTTEFDMYRRSAEKMAALMERNGKLLELGILKGVQHGSYFDYNQKRTDEWFYVFQKAMKQYM